MQIINYPRTPTLKTESVILTGSVEDGTKGIRADHLATQLLNFLDPDAFYEWCDAIKISVRERRNIYRGKYLGDEVTPLQQARIRNGTFEGMFIGDYWEINGHKHVIVDFDYYLNCYLDWNYSPSERIRILTHHVTLETHSSFRSVYSDSNVATDGYLNSKIFTEIIPTNILPILVNDFGNHLQEMSLRFSNSVDSNGAITSNAFSKVSVVLPTSKMLYNINSASAPNSENQAETEQLSYYKIVKTYKEETWLRDIANFLIPGWTGYVLVAATQSVFGVAPNSREYECSPIFSIQYG